MRGDFNPNYLDDIFDECIGSIQVKYSMEKIRNLLRERIRKEFFDEIHLASDAELNNLAENILKCLLKIVETQREFNGKGPIFVE